MLRYLNRIFILLLLAYSGLYAMTKSKSDELTTVPRDVVVTMRPLTPSFLESLKTAPAPTAISATAAISDFSEQNNLNDACDNIYFSSYVE